jgi:FlaA1/EpsC-like NDP-sugar epimerase
MGIIDFLAKNKKTFFFVCDAAIVAFSVWLAFMVRFEAQVPADYFVIILRLILLGWAFYLPSFAMNRMYAFSWSYVSTQELISLTRAAGVALALQVVFLFVFRGYSFFSGYPRSTIFIAGFFVFLFCGGLRFAKRVYLYLFKPKSSEGKSRVLIAGAGDTGEQLLRSILNSSASRYHVVGFIDNNETRQGNIIHDIKVLGKMDDIPNVVSKYGIEEIIIALPAGSKLIKEAVRLGKKAGIKKIKIVPPLSEIIDGNISLSNIRKVEVADLLERDQVSLDTTAIGKFIFGKTVLITGAAGSIGSELSRQVCKFNPGKIIILDQDETGIFNIESELKKHFPGLVLRSYIADIQNAARIAEVFDECRPQVVFHAAAYKHVPLMEANIGEAVRNNIFGTKTVGEAAIGHNAERFIFISTDKAINPTSVMGATKRIGEMLCQMLNGRGVTKFVSVRFGNVLGSRGSVIPIFREQIRRGGPVEVTHPEMKRYFMMISEACLLVMQAGAMGGGGEVFVLDMGKPVKILDLAKEMIKLSGFEPDKEIPIVYTGIRPGEKLFEELLTAEEGADATQSNKIFVAKLLAVDSAAVEKNLDELKIVLEKPGNKQAVAGIFKRLMPYFPE